jgi:CheY-like chemotaxis protein
MKSRIFVLEDNIDRITLFHKYLPLLFPEASFVFAESAQEASCLLRKEKYFDIAFLDHDLGGKAFVDSEEENTGYQVVKMMLDRNITCGQVVVHSMNPAGAANMVALFSPEVRVDYIPFPSLLDYFKR